MRLSILVPLADILLSGCASSITAWKNRPVADHTLRPDRFFSLTAERRLAFQVNKSNPNNIAWCAESLPEAAQAVSATSKITGKSKSTEGGIDDAYSTSLTQTFVRTEIAEVYRQMAFQACQAWAQKVYNDAHYRAKLDEILDAGIAVIKLRATQPLTSPSEPKAAAAGAAPAPKPTATPTPKPSASATPVAANQ